MTKKICKNCGAILIYIRGANDKRGTTRRDCPRCGGLLLYQHELQSAGQTETLGPATTWHDDYDPYDPDTHMMGHA